MPLRSEMTCSLEAGREPGSLACRHRLCIISCRWVTSVSRWTSWSCTGKNQMFITFLGGQHSTRPLFLRNMNQSKCCCKQIRSNKGLTVADWALECKCIICLLTSLGERNPLFQRQKMLTAKCFTTYSILIVFQSSGNDDHNDDDKKQQYCISSDPVITIINSFDYDVIPAMQCSTSTRWPYYTVQRFLDHQWSRPCPLCPPNNVRLGM